ncbi:hypothetical protein C1I94_04075 [Akkermansia muciniphila]|uniref:hypothetical protein n=1 Tax=Akkermansia muciniphila TaxID=239935 RepID=UPI000FE15947|nr:hypothetical protein [Akkermansia muciniphila]QAA40865.1 hypothetical protein C1I94_04075 [Akkermansia muciniphila]
MPPDSSIPPNPQARPCATLALRPGWLASGLGVGARTGLHAELTAYSIVFWGTMPFRRRRWLPGSRKRHASWQRCP